MDCIFCKIAAHEAPSTVVYEDDLIIAFHDLAPKAPVHVQVIPKAHIASADELNSENAGIAAHAFSKIPGIAASLGLGGGYRVVTNVGEDAGQIVQHLHFHILGGEPLGGDFGSR